MSRIAIAGLTVSDQPVTYGIARVILNLTAGLVKRGVKVDLLAFSTGLDADAARDQAPEGASIYTMPLRPNRKAIPVVQDYLRRYHPDAIISAGDKANIICSSSVDPRRHRLWTTLHWHYSRAYRDYGWLKRQGKILGMRRWHRMSAGTIAVSDGVATDFAATTGISRTKINVIPNPVVFDSIETSATHDPIHPWLAPDQPPVIVGVGRLVEQKDFATLIRAFALLRKRRKARLMILGEGAQRPLLEKLIDELGITDDVALPGFVNNPFSYIARAGVLALSSAWEGLPTVLIEALALGIPVVSTNCPSGPAEILANGRFGQLVPIGNEYELANAIDTTIAKPPDRNTLRAAASQYRVDTIAQKYMTVMGINAN